MPINSFLDDFSWCWGLILVIEFDFCVLWEICRYWDACCKVGLGVFVFESIFWGVHLCFASCKRDKSPMHLIMIDNRIMNSWDFFVWGFQISWFFLRVLGGYYEMEHRKVNFPEINTIILEKTCQYFHWSLQYARFAHFLYTIDVFSLKDPVTR